MIISKTIFINILKQLHQSNPNPKIELDYLNDYTLMVAIILSAQSTDKGVNKATKALFAIVQTPEDMVQLGEEGLKSYIKSIGLYNSKGKNIIAMSKVLIDQHQGILPSDRKELMALPGIGRKSANVFLNSIYKIPTIGVDTHVMRVSNRIGFCNESKPEKVEFALESLCNEYSIDLDWKLKLHHWLVLHGRYTCIAKKPKCHECKISQYCKLYQENKNL